MNCINCGKKLNPYFLKQVQLLDSGDVYELECIKCRRYNYVDRETYRHISLDYEMPTIQPINLKLPKDLNVIFCSMRRCGISWVIRELSRFHEKMFGCPIPFPASQSEITSSKATLGGYPLPKGWNNVYDVDPQELLDRIDPEGNKYDKIVVIHRDLKTLTNVNKITWAREGLHESHINKLLSKLPEEYETVYGKDIQDPRLLRLDLWGINQYPESCFEELMDFLNFPKHNRPIGIGIKTLPFLKLWEAYSSVWDKDFKLTGMLGRVEGLFTMSYDGLLDYLAKDALESNKKIDLRKILIIGPKTASKSHFGENIRDSFIKKGYECEIVSSNELFDTPGEFMGFKKRENICFLSGVLSKVSIDPDLIIIDEGLITYYNDTDIPVFYHHREFKRPPTIYYPDIAFFWHEGVLNYFKNIFAPYWFHKVGKSIILPIAVNSTFQPNKKTIQGIVGLAWRERIKDVISIKEITAQGILYESIKAYQEVSQYIEILNDNGTLTNDRFRELLSKSEAFWCHVPLGQYTTRRMLEAMACKTLVVLKLQNEEHERVLLEMGFEKGVHYVGLKKYSELKELKKDFDIKKYEPIIENAFEVVKTRHTYNNRADYIIELYKDFSVRNKIRVR